MVETPANCRNNGLQTGAGTLLALGDNILYNRYCRLFAVTHFFAAAIAS
jgi:hypothetical protein